MTSEQIAEAIVDERVAINADRTARQNDRRATGLPENLSAEQAGAVGRASPGRV
jgi:hypothetical protein